MFLVLLLRCQICSAVSEFALGFYGSTLVFPNLLFVFGSFALGSWCTLHLHQESEPGVTFHPPSLLQERFPPSPPPAIISDDIRMSYVAVLFLIFSPLTLWNEKEWECFSLEQLCVLIRLTSNTRLKCSGFYGGGGCFGVVIYKCKAGDLQWSYIILAFMDSGTGYEMRGRIRQVPQDRRRWGRNEGVMEVSRGFSGVFLADCQHESPIHFSE